MRFLIFFLMFFYGCSQNQLSDIQSGSELDLKGLASQLKKIKTNVNKSVVRGDLIYKKLVTKIINGKDKAGISIPGFGGATLGKKEQVLSLYFIEAKIVKKDGKKIVSGIGYSVHYLFRRKSRNINISNLPLIAAAVQLDSDKNEVVYSLQSFGIGGSALNRFFKPVVDAKFDVNGFGIIQSYCDGIHNALSMTSISKDLKFTPVELSSITPSDLTSM